MGHAAGESSVGETSLHAKDNEWTNLGLRVLLVVLLFSAAECSLLLPVLLDRNALTLPADLPFASLTIPDQQNHLSLLLQTATGIWPQAQLLHLPSHRNFPLPPSVRSNRSYHSQWDIFEQRSRTALTYRLQGHLLLFCLSHRTGLTQPQKSMWGGLEEDFRKTVGAYDYRINKLYFWGWPQRPSLAPRNATVWAQTQKLIPLFLQDAG